MLLRKKMNLTRSLLDDIETKQLQWYGHVQRETIKRSTGMATIKEKETRQTQTYLGGGD
jgi:hypothetical protein